MPPPVICVLDGESPLAPAALHLLAHRDVQVAVGHGETVDPERVRRLGPCGLTHAYPDPRDPTASFEAGLLEWLESERPDVVLPLGIESTLAVSRHAAALEKMGVRAPVPPHGLVMHASNRAILWGLARSAGISLPQVEAMAAAESVSAPLDRFAHLPAVAPRRLTWGDSAVCPRSEEGVREAHRRLARRTGDPPVLVEQIPADAGWFAVTVLCDAPGGVMACLCEAWTGWDREAGHPRWRAVSAHAGAVETALRLLGSLGWSGPAAVQLCLDPRDATLKLLQVWPGLSGGVALAAEAGLDLVWPLVEWALGRTPSHPKPHRTDLFTTWRPDGVPWLFTPRVEPDGPKTPRPQGHEVKIDP